MTPIYCNNCGKIAIVPMPYKDKWYCRSCREKVMKTDYKKQKRGNNA